MTPSTHIIYAVRQTWVPGLQVFRITKGCQVGSDKHVEVHKKGRKKDQGSAMLYLKKNRKEPKFKNGRVYRRKTQRGIRGER